MILGQRSSGFRINVLLTASLGLSKTQETFDRMGAITPL
ncbi:hypothetical protein M595_3158 [Lyngbya aestuarii BL J]|uniref:Uncharacterized protein n=1 Tax=Lyngbya aestuarii BL J TaxID=1348334 RepID=U7QGA7_9CYAN|nr:hypothetical protein M595_3158 [Lyngbya aestuarii BL J]